MKKLECSRMQSNAVECNRVPSKAPSDAFWLRMALAEARKGEGLTRPNPPVGAVLVQDGVCIGKGYHHAAGKPHAEVEAFEEVSFPGNAATLYVTLEPCSTHGRTPPCTERIIREGFVKRVVIGCLDMNPRHAGHGVALLQAAGIDVSVIDTTHHLPLTTHHSLLTALRSLIAPFQKWVTTGRPFLTLKLAQTRDGFIGVKSKPRVIISCPESLARVQRMRRRVDAVMVGVGTVLADNPRLLCAKARRGQELWRVVVDSRGRTPLSSTVCTDAARGRTVIAVTSLCPAHRRRAFEEAGVNVWTLPWRGGKVSLPALAERMGREGWLHVLCEGGGELAGALVRERLVDELHLATSPRTLGRGIRTFGKEKNVDRAFTWTRREKVGQDEWRTGIQTAKYAEK